MASSTIMVMISFEPLDIDEANAFLEQSIRGFIAERLSADQVNDAVLDRARKELRQRLLPNGTLTSGHRFEAIVSGGERVGLVWFGPLPGSDTDVFICDISIDVDRRREGHARAAIELILDYATQSHASRVGLTVVQANTAAVGLYESLGFATTRSDDTDREMWTIVGPK